MKKILITAIGIPMVLSGCMSNTPSGVSGASDFYNAAPGVHRTFWNWNYCVDQNATAKINAEANVGSTGAITHGMNACERELSAYVSHLVSNTKRKNGWSSVQPEVPPRIREGVRQETLAEMKPYYSRYISSKR